MEQLQSIQHLQLIKPYPLDVVNVNSTTPVNEANVSSQTHLDGQVSQGNISQYTLEQKLELLHSTQTQIMSTIVQVASFMLQGSSDKNLWDLLIALSNCGREQMDLHELLTRQNGDGHIIAEKAAQVEALLHHVTSPASKEEQAVCEKNNKSPDEKPKVKTKTHKSTKNQVKGKKSQQGNSNEVYYIEKIVGKKKVDGKTYYRVKWTGFPSSANNWEPVSSFCSKSIIRQYNAKLRARKLKQKQEASSKNVNAINCSKSSNALSSSSKSNERPLYDSDELNNRRSMRLILKELRDTDGSSVASSHEDC